MVATDGDANHVVPILQRCTAKSIEWASRHGPQFDTAMMDAALFTHRQGHRKHHRAKLTSMIRVRNESVRFNRQATRLLGVWMDAHLTFKQNHNRWMKTAWAEEARLRTPTKTYGLVCMSVRAIQVASVQAVARDGSELCWHPREVGRRDNLQLLFNQQARSILGELPTTPLGALMRESGLTQAAVILDSRHQPFAARQEYAWSSNLKEVHKNPSSGAPRCGAVRKEHVLGRTTEGMTWLAPGKEPVIRTTILEDTTAAKSAVQPWAGEKEAKIGAGVRMMWTDESRSEDGRVGAAAVCKHAN